jgi:hypothetical protein
MRECARPKAGSACLYRARGGHNNGGAYGYCPRYLMLDRHAPRFSAYAPGTRQLQRRGRSDDALNRSFGPCNRCGCIQYALTAAATSSG